jgi:hypothetical protein
VSRGRVVLAAGTARSLTDPPFASVAEDGTLLDDFWLDEVPNVTLVRNAPSPAATSSLALAKRIADAIGDAER